MILITRAWEVAAAQAPMRALGYRHDGWRFEFKPEATPEQQTAARAAVEAIDWSDAAVAAWQAGKIRAAAKATYQDVTALGRLVRALALVTLDEINILRTLHGLAPRTAAQLRSAIETKIDGE